MKNKDTQLIEEAYTQVQEGFGDVAKSGAKMAGKTIGKVGLAATGVAAKTAGIGLDGLMKALNYLTSEQLQKLGQAALNKADQIKISDEENC
jgi:hypothetical protein